MRYMNRRRREISPEETAANRAKKELRAKRCATCQICGRAILANTGFIAHHGYERPGEGYQTASCAGARELPFEVSSDALPPAIESVKAYIANQEKGKAEWLANPPAGIEDSRKKSYGWNEYRVEWSVLRPADFVHTTADDRYTYHESGSYVSLYRSGLAGYDRRIKNSQDTLAYFEDRLANWKPTLTLAQWEARTIEVNS